MNAATQEEVEKARKREEDLAFAKKRAIEYIEHGDLTGAIDSMASDLTKWNIADPHLVAMMCLTIRMNANLTAQEVKSWVEGWN